MRRLAIWLFFIGIVVGFAGTTYSMQRAFTNAGEPAPDVTPYIKLAFWFTFAGICVAALGAVLFLFSVLVSICRHRGSPGQVRDISN